ncbi:MAG: hypothetical protein GMKNLPBB_02096 [Myxococcota bacterium]|nr:hypothetical protein [Myxococcota bacterium]
MRKWIHRLGFITLHPVQGALQAGMEGWGLALALPLMIAAPLILYPYSIQKLIAAVIVRPASGLLSLGNFIAMPVMVEILAVYVFAFILRMTMRRRAMTYDRITDALFVALSWKVFIVAVSGLAVRLIALVKPDFLAGQGIPQALLPSFPLRPAIETGLISGPGLIALKLLLQYGVSVIIGIAAVRLLPRHGDPAPQEQETPA